MTRDEILDQLASLLPSQLEMVMFLCKVPPEYLSPPSAPQVVRAIDLIRYCEQAGELDKLVAILNQVREHELSPASDYGVKKAAPAPTPVLRCFVAYAHRDRDLFDELRKHLSGLVRSQRLDVSSRDEFEVGGSIAGQMVTEVNQSNLILLLVSPDYLASEALHQITTLAMQRSDTGQVRVVPIIVRPAEWSEAPFARLSALPRDGRAITARTDRDSAWVDVVQGLQLVLKDLGGMLATETRAGTGRAAGRSTARAVSIANESPRARRRIGDIFRAGGTPDDTFVEPDRFRRLRIALATMGKGLVVEGPSGIGKTVAVKKALQELKQPFKLLSGVHRDDVVELSKLLQGTIDGHLVVDDFHRLDAALKTQLANQIKYLADSDQRDAKITLLGVNHAGMSLTAELPDLAGRVDVFPMGRQPDAKIEQLILQGERAANLVFVRRSEFVLESLGSFYTAQQLCLSAAGEHGIEETMATLTPIDAGPRDVIPDLMNDLDRVFAQPLLGFAALDHGAPRRGACLALLWLLSRAQSGHVLLTEARNRLQQPDLGASFEWLRSSTLKQAIASVPRLDDLLFYDPQAQLLSIENPRLEFYLRNLSFEEFGRRAGVPVEVRPDDRLIFRTIN